MAAIVLALQKSRDIQNALYDTQIGSAMELAMDGVVIICHTILTNADSTEMIAVMPAEFAWTSPHSKSNQRSAIANIINSMFARMT